MTVFGDKHEITSFERPKAGGTSPDMDIAVYDIRSGELTML